MSQEQVGKLLVVSNELPPTKIRRKYSCQMCGNFTFNPRIHLKHLQEEHGQKIRIVSCPYCQYACQYRQKLNRHLRLVHKLFTNGNGTETGFNIIVSSNEMSNDTHHHQLNNQNLIYSTSSSYPNLMVPTTTHHSSAFDSHQHLHYHHQHDNQNYNHNLDYDLPYDLSCDSNEPMDLSMPKLAGVNSIDTK